MFRNPLLLIALTLTAGVAVWGIFDTQGLAGFAGEQVKVMFRSRGWFVMLTASMMLIASIWLALSRFGGITLGRSGDEPEFSTFSWLAMKARPLAFPPREPLPILMKSATGS